MSSAFLRRCKVDSAFLKSGRRLIGIVSESTKFERIHQLPRYTSIFFFCGNMTVVFACKSVHFKDDFFRATQLDHRLSEPRVTDKSIMNVFVLFLLTPLLKLFCRVEFFATFFLPVPVTVWSALPDVEVWDREEIQHGRDVLLVFCCIISQEVSTRALDSASVPIRQACFALCFWLNIEYFAQFSVSSSCNRIF